MANETELFRAAAEDFEFVGELIPGCSFEYFWQAYTNAETCRRRGVSPFLLRILNNELRDPRNEKAIA